jgi:hypothetical protein
MGTGTHRYKRLPRLLGLALATLSGLGLGLDLDFEVAVPPAAARPLRQPAISTLLHDLAQIEIHNADRDDQKTAQLIAQQIASTRAALLRVSTGAQPLGPVLRSTLSNLYLMAGYNRRSTDTDDDVLLRIGGSIEHMRLRTELTLQKESHTGSPIPQPPPDYRPPLGYKPPGYEPLPYVSPIPPSPPTASTFTPPPSSPAPPSPAMTQTTFVGLLTKMQRLSFGDEKLGLARDAATSGNFFTCEQVMQLMQTSAFADEQIKIGATLYKRVVDPQNFVQLTSTLAFESDRDKLRQLVGR